MAAARAPSLGDTREMIDNFYPGKSAGKIVFSDKIRMNELHPPIAQVLGWNRTPDQTPNAMSVFYQQFRKMTANEPRGAGNENGGLRGLFAF